MRDIEGEEARDTSPEILGHAPSMQEVFRAIGRLSQSNATVLITGESGTGKELVALALHRHSNRSAKPFVAINTAAMPKDLLESELFGHERGAFTGAQAMRRGRFEQAEGGTLFLDEIGDMPAELQTRLLRVLSHGQFYRVGGHQSIKANVRVIAATHQDLEERVRDGLFREDLFHRLNVIRLRLPSLRERHEDIPLLAKHFLAKSARELGAEGKRMSDAAINYLAAQYFPGKVPELDWVGALEREVERAFARGETRILDPFAQVFEKVLIGTSLTRTGGRRIEAANLLGMGRNTITRKIAELGLEAKGGPDEAV